MNELQPIPRGSLPQPALAAGAFDMIARRRAVDMAGPGPEARLRRAARVLADGPAPQGRGDPRDVSRRPGRLPDDAVRRPHLPGADDARDSGTQRRVPEHEERQPGVGGDSGYLDTDIQTQVKLLQSRALLSRVQEKLDARAAAGNLQPPDRLGMWRKALKINPPTPKQLWAQALGTAAGSVRVRSSGTNRIVDVSCDSTQRPARRRLLQHAHAGIHRPEPRSALEDHRIHRPVADQAARRT